VVACSIASATVLFLGLQQTSVIVLDDSFEMETELLRSPDISNETGPYTVLIATFRRDNCLIKAIPHYLTCNIAEVRVKWQDYKRPVPEWLQKAAQEHPDRLAIDVADGDYLSSRFKVENLIGEAVFTVDDDERFSCEYLRQAFRLWRKTPNRLVGYSPRRLLDNGCYDAQANYLSMYPTANTLFVTKGAFFDPKYLKEYFSSKYDALRKMVDGNLTGEDILMSYIVALNNPPGQRWVVPLYGGGIDEDFECASSRALSKLSADSRCAIQHHFQSELGFPFEYTPWGDFYLWEKPAGTFLPFSASGHWAMPWYPLRMYLRFRRNRRH